MRPEYAVVRKTGSTVAAVLAVFAATFLFMSNSRGASGTLWSEKSPQELGSAASQLSLKTFATLAKEVSPAVVNISSSKKPEGKKQAWRRRGPGHFGPDWPGQDPFEFFRRFLGEEFPQLGPRQALGTGFIINDTGYILTNNHNVEGWDEIVVKLLNDGKEYKATIVGTDPKTDIALLKIDAGKKLAVAPLGDSDKLEVGEWVVAIGNPFGLSHTVTAGIVSFKGRKEVEPEGRKGYYDFIQTDASINPGNSGGPLLNIYGEVVAINTAVNMAAQGMGFAVPINMAKAILPQLKDKGKVARSWLGVRIQGVDQNLASSYGMKEAKGALVSEVLKDGPAEAARLKEGDIIISFDGKPINEMQDLPWLASMAGTGREVDVKFLRDGREQTAKVKLGELPEDEELAMHPLVSGGGGGEEEEELGITVSQASEAELKKLGVKDLSAAVVVGEIKPDSPAERAGILAGDLVIKVNDEEIKSIDDFKRASSKIKAGNIVRLFLRRGSTKLFVAFRK